MFTKLVAKVDLSSSIGTSKVGPPRCSYAVSFVHLLAVQSHGGRRRLAGTGLERGTLEVVRGAAEPLVKGETTCATVAAKGLVASGTDSEALAVECWLLVRPLSVLFFPLPLPFPGLCDAFPFPLPFCGVAPTPSRRLVVDLVLWWLSGSLVVSTLA